ncbi:MAG: GNAT family protein [Lachnospiraceae bacterium]|nr:GNAT family protein [Lachnospiraceae bacterium]
MYQIRELKRQDMKRINEWRNNPEVIMCLGSPFRYINDEVDDKWFDYYMCNRDKMVRCSIISEESPDDIIGLVSLTNINYINRSASFHIMIGKKENQNIGAGTFATKKMLEHGFLNMNLNRIELATLSNNVRAQHLYKKCGLKKEGVKRECCYKNGKYLDEEIYSILRKEFLENFE